MTGLNSSCGACKFLRRRCTNECIFAPYFSYEHATTHFSAVHKVFGASNVSKLLSCLPVLERTDAAITVAYEALARMHDPVYGCVSHIFSLQQQIACLMEEIEVIENQMANRAVDICNNPYLFTQSNIDQSVPILDSEIAAVDQISEIYLDSGIIERLLQELDQD
ncbi:hypothetical protein ACJIZ3_023027 [Penstemon smallii]|uniref:LOB domain-containing protein n=1 Tax=Penstemon smallii TaxID=265156 RepID=A0ABD3TP70_9LAMI